MSIEAGAFLEGMCRRMDSAKSPFDDATLSATVKTKAKRAKAAQSVDESGGEEEQAAATAYSSRRKLQPASFGDNTKRASSNNG